MLVLATDQKIAGATGSSIGDLTGGGNLAAAFDGTLAQALAASASKSSATFGYIGKSYTGGKIVTRAVLVGTNNAGYVNSINPTVTLDLYGKNGSAPANSTDGTLLGTVSFTDTADESGTARQVSTTVRVPYAHVWVRVSHNGASNTIGVAEIIFFEAWLPPLPSPTRDYTPDSPLIGWHNLVAFGGITADTEDADFPASNLANGTTSTSTIWRADDTTAQGVNFDVDGVVDYLGIAKPNFATAGINVSLLGRTGTEPFIEIVGAHSPTDDGVIVFRFPSQDLDDLRLLFTSGSVEAEMACVYAGEIMVVQRRLYVGHRPVTMSREVEFSNGVTDGANFLGRTVIGEKLDTTIDLVNLTADWVRATLMPFLRNCDTEPFFYCWRPDTYPDECAFVWTTNAPKPENQRSNGMMSCAIAVDGTT